MQTCSVCVVSASLLAECCNHADIGNSVCLMTGLIETGRGAQIFLISIGSCVQLRGRAVTDAVSRYASAILKMRRWSN